MNASENQQDVWNELIEFIRNYTSISFEFPISRHTTIVADIGLDGDDADEFMVVYAKRFGVDAGDFRFPDYFGPGGIRSDWSSNGCHTAKTVPQAIDHRNARARC